MAEHGSKTPRNKAGAEKKAGGGFWGILGGLLDNVSIDVNVPGRAGGAARNPTDPADRMEPVHAERKEAYEETIYRKTEGAEGTAPAVRVDRDRQAIARSLDGRMAPRQESRVPQGGGAPLSRDVRAKMEPKLGSDLSAVRVHTSGESAAAAEGLSAKAFTVGDDVHFASGNYQPGTKEGDRLLAHELTHVVQGQRSGIQRKAHDAAHEGAHDGAAPEADVSHPDEPAEKEADGVADKVTDELHDGGKKIARGGDAAAPAHAAPAPISAKLSGVGRKIFRADNKKKPQGATPQQAPAKQAPPATTSTPRPPPGANYVNSTNTKIGPRPQAPGQGQQAQAGQQQAPATSPMSATEKKEILAAVEAAEAQSENVLERDPLHAEQGAIERKAVDQLPEDIKDESRNFLVANYGLFVHDPAWKADNGLRYITEPLRHPATKLQVLLQSGATTFGSGSLVIKAGGVQVQRFGCIDLFDPAGAIKPAYDQSKLEIRQVQAALRGERDAINRDTVPAGTKVGDAKSAMQAEIRQEGDKIKKIEAELAARKQQYEQQALALLAHKGFNDALHMHTEQAFEQIMAASPQLYVKLLQDNGIRPGAAVIGIVNDLHSTNAVCGICGDAMTKMASSKSTLIAAVTGALKAAGYLIAPGGLQCQQTASFTNPYQTKPPPADERKDQPTMATPVAQTETPKGGGGAGGIQPRRS